MFYNKRIKKLEERIKDLELNFGMIVGSWYDKCEWIRES